MIVGITGHMNLKERGVYKWVRQELSCWLYRHEVELGLTCLAPGTDQIFAVLCYHQHIPFRFIQPCENYLSAFQQKDQEQIIFLAQKATATVVLPIKEVSEQAYLEGGIEMVNQCDCLIAVWDGFPARGLGGTGDIVTYAAQKAKPIIHLDITEQKTVELT